MAESESVWSEVTSLLQRVLGLNQDTSWPMRGANKGKIDKNLMRLDGSAKGPGFVGPQRMTGDAEGNVATELSLGTPSKGMLSAHRDEGFYPLISESQDPTTMSWILSGRKPTQEMYRTARKDYERRKSEGKGAFAKGVALPGKLRGKDRFPEYQGPEPLKRANKAQYNEATRRMQNYQAAQDMQKPGAMVLDAPAMPYLDEKQRKDFFERHGIPYRQSGPATSNQLPKGTIITQPPRK